MEFQWFQDLDYPVSLPRYDQYNNCEAVSSFTDYHACHAIDFNTGDPNSLHYFLEEGENEEIDIETIPVSQLDIIEMRPAVAQKESFPNVEPIQQTFTNEIHSVKQIESILRLGNDQPAPEANWENAESFSGNSSIQNWRLLQYSDSYGGTYQLAVNNEVQNHLQQINTQYVLSDQHDSRKLYQYLTTASSHESSENEQMEPESTEIVVDVEIHHHREETFPPQCSPIEEMMVDDGSSSNLDLLQEKPEEPLAPVMSSQIPATFESIDDFQPITNNTQAPEEVSEQIHSEEEIPNDVVVPLPSNPEPALPRVSRLEIGPFCTAAGIFANDLNLNPPTNNRNKLPADQLKNGIVFEIYTHLVGARYNRRILIRVICDFFDIPYFNWEDSRTVAAFFRKAVLPMMARRTELDKRYAVTRSSSQAKINAQSKCQELIIHFDSDIFAITMEPDESPPRPKPAKVTKKTAGKKPTQGQQLLQLQASYDAFRRKQRKLNIACFRHMATMKRRVDAMERLLPRRPFSALRRSSHNITL